MPCEIRGIKPDEYEELIGILSNHMMIEKEDFATLYKNDPTYKYSLSRVCIVDKKIVANVHIYDREMHIGKCIVRNGGIGDVLTLPEYRRRGYATSLLNDAVKYMRENGYDLSMIIGIALYGKVGWEIFPQDLFTLKVKKKEIPIDHQYTVRRFEKENDLDSIIKIYEDYNINRSMGIVRSKEYWRKHFYWIRDEREDGFLVAERKGKIVAYLRCAGFKDELHLNEICYLKEYKSAISNLLEAILRFAVSRGYKTINTYLPLDHPLINLLDSMEGAEHKLIEPFGKAGMFFRLINIEGLFNKMIPCLEERLNNSSLSSYSGFLTFEVSGQILTLKIKNNKIEISNENKKGIYLNPNQNMFFKMIMGYCKPSQMKIGEKFSLSTKEVELLDILFPITYPIFWHSDYY